MLMTSIEGEDAGESTVNSASGDPVTAAWTTHCEATASPDVVMVRKRSSTSTVVP